MARPLIKAAIGDLVSFLSLLRKKVLASCLLFRRRLVHFRRAYAPFPLETMAGVEAWPPCNVTKSALEARVNAGILRPLKDVEFPEWIVPSVNDREPNPPPGYVVCFLSFLDRGFGVPAGRLIRAILHYYEVELHNLNPNSVMQAVVFATVCEGFLSIGISGFTSSRRRWRLVMWERRSFPCEPAAARCSFVSNGPGCTSGARCLRQTEGGRAGGSTSGVTAVCCRSTLERW